MFQTMKFREDIMLIYSVLVWDLRKINPAQKRLQAAQIAAQKKYNYNFQRNAVINVAQILQWLTFIQNIQWKALKAIAVWRVVSCDPV